MHFYRGALFPLCFWNSIILVLSWNLYSVERCEDLQVDEARVLDRLVISS